MDESREAAAEEGSATATAASVEAACKQFGGLKHLCHHPNRAFMAAPAMHVCRSCGTFTLGS